MLQSTPQRGGTFQGNYFKTSGAPSANSRQFRELWERAQCCVLSPTTLTRALLHAQLRLTHLCRTLSFTRTLSHTHTTFRQTTLSQTTFHTQLSHTRTQLLTYFDIQLLENSKSLILRHLLSPFFFLHAASATFPDYWKKLICGAIRSSNVCTSLPICSPSYYS